MTNRTLLVLLPLLAAGCGYSQRYETPAGIESLAVSVMKNNTLYHDLELELTDAVVTEVSSKTPLRVRNTGDADAVLSGTLDDYGRRVLREGSHGVVQEYQLRAVVSFKLTSLATHQVLREGTGVGWQVDYTPALGETEDQARKKLFRDLARKIVSRALEDW